MPPPPAVLKTLERTLTAAVNRALKKGEWTPETLPSRIARRGHVYPVAPPARSQVRPLFKAAAILFPTVKSRLDAIEANRAACESEMAADE